MGLIPPFSVIGQCEPREDRLMKWTPEEIWAWIALELMRREINRKLGWR